MTNVVRDWADVLSDEESQFADIWVCELEFADFRGERVQVAGLRLEVSLCGLGGAVDAANSLQGLVMQ